MPGSAGLGLLSGFISFVTVPLGIAANQALNVSPLIGFDALCCQWQAG
jgi:hypothetical protein